MSRPPVHLGGRDAAGAAWSMQKLLERGLGLVSTLILARLLVPEDFGLVAIASSFVALLELLRMFGFDMALIQLRTVTQSHMDTAWTFAAVLGLGVAVLVASLAPVVAAPATESVSVSFGNFPQDLPPGSFACDGLRCLYTGQAPGVVDAVIEEDSIAFRAEGLNLSPTDNPIWVAIQIGDDAGRGSVRLEGNLGLAPTRGKIQPLPVAVTSEPATAWSLGPASETSSPLPPAVQNPENAVAVLGAPWDPGWLEDVRSEIEATGLFTRVDTFHVRLLTPTLDQLPKG